MSIGKIEDGSKLEIDVQKLLETRLLIEANSGGGKSYLIRKILEETYGKVQQIVLDMEGEFSTLREKYDYILAGKEGDIPADPRSAELLARKILELGTSIIIDLYELKHQDRIKFVKNFLDSMINAPKELWHPVLVILDEAHVFVPEKGESEASSAVIDLATRGRKRGFGSVLATQRLSKLHKDVAAEMINKLIGRTSLDIDMKRAAEELGFTSKKEMFTLRELEPGQFFAFGPALSKNIVKVTIGKVKTTHPHAGERIAVQKPVATKKVLKVLAKLTDLPKEAEQELKTKEEMKAEISKLKMELRSKPKAELDPTAVKRQTDIAYSRGVNEMSKSYFDNIRKAEVEFNVVVNDLKKENQMLVTMLNKVKTIVGGQAIEIKNPVLKKIETPKVQPMHTEIKMLPRIIDAPRNDIQIENTLNGEKTKFRAGAMRMLKAAAMFHPKPITRRQISTLVGIAPSGSTFSTYITELKNAGYLIESGDSIEITAEGRENAGEVQPLPTDPMELLAMWKSKFRAGAARMLDVITECYPNEISKEDIAAKTGIDSVGSTFSTYINELKNNGLVVIEGKMVRASKELFLEEF